MEQESKEERRRRMSRERNRRYRANMSTEARACKALRDKKSREAKAANRLKLNDTLLEEGRRICSRCFHKKQLTEFSKNKRIVADKYNEICDICLIKSYATASYSPDVLTPAFWRKKAYSCNTTAMSRFKRTGEVRKLQDLPYKMTGVDLVEIYDKQQGLCIYCTEDLSSGAFQMDHRIPLSRGGTHIKENIDIVCSFCNRAKHNMLPEEFIEAALAYAKRIVAIEHEDKEPRG